MNACALVFPKNIVGASIGFVASFGAAGGAIFVSRIHLSKSLTTIGGLTFPRLCACVRFIAIHDRRPFRQIHRQSDDALYPRPLRNLPRLLGTHSDHP